MKARLVCRTPSKGRLSFDVPEGEALLGREAGCTVRLPLDGVSRQHAVISWDGKYHWIQDMKSTNGTFVNGELARRERLRHLDVIGLGKTAEVLFLLRATEAPRPLRRRGILRAALVPEGGDGLPIELPVGECTIGRSAACNIVAGNAAVSKFHARLDRSAERLILTDLGSANGTRVNDRDSKVATLEHGDVVSLAGVEKYRVEIEAGERDVSVEMPRPAAVSPASAAAPRPEFSREWRTRLEWDTNEMADLQRLIGAAGAGVPAAGVGGTIRVPPKQASPSVDGTLRPGKQKAVPSAPAAGRPTATPEAAQPTPASTPPAPSASKPLHAPAVPAKAQADAKPAPAPPAVEPKPPVASRAVPAQPVSAAAKTPTPPIREVIIEGEGVTVRVTEPGRHQLGRSREASLRVDHPTVHRKHADLMLSDDRSRLEIEDLGGANGTLVNDVLVKRAPLAHGDRLTLGEARMTVRIVR